MCQIVIAASRFSKYPYSVARDDFERNNQIPIIWLIVEQ
jgi:hypothetical protein